MKKEDLTSIPSDDEIIGCGLANADKEKLIMDCIELYIEQEYEEVLHLCNESIEYWPSEAEFFHYRALVRLRNRLDSEALDDFRQAFELQKEWGYFTNLFVHLLKLKQKEDALRLLRGYFCLFSRREQINISRMLNEHIEAGELTKKDLVDGMSDHGVLNLPEFGFLFKRLREPSIPKRRLPYIDLDDLDGDF